MKGVLKAIEWSVGVALGLVVLAIVAVNFLPGWGMYIVHSGSMEPVLSPRDLIVTCPAGGQVEPGEIVTFIQGEQRRAQQ